MLFGGSSIKDIVRSSPCWGRSRAEPLQTRWVLAFWPSESIWMHNLNVDTFCGNIVDHFGFVRSDKPHACWSSEAHAQPSGPASGGNQEGSRKDERRESLLVLLPFARGQSLSSHFDCFWLFDLRSICGILVFGKKTMFEFDPDIDFWLVDVSILDLEVVSIATTHVDANLGFVARDAEENQI